MKGLCEWVLQQKSRSLSFRAELKHFGLWVAQKYGVGIQRMELIKQKPESHGMENSPPQNQNNPSAILEPPESPERLRRSLSSPCAWNRITQFLLVLKRQDTSADIWVGVKCCSWKSSSPSLCFSNINTPIEFFHKHLNNNSLTLVVFKPSFEEKN